LTARRGRRDGAGHLFNNHSAAHDRYNGTKASASQQQQQLKSAPFVPEDMSSVQREMDEIRRRMNEIISRLHKHQNDNSSERARSGKDYCQREN
jgi:hypothetical protein